MVKKLLPRLVERYGVPCSSGTYEDKQHIRGSNAGIQISCMFEALNFCKDLLAVLKAARVSLPAAILEALRSRLKHHSTLNQNT